MSEQFGINRTLRNSTTVDSNILPVLPPAILMNNLRKTFFLTPLSPVISTDKSVGATEWQHLWRATMPQYFQ